MTKRKLPENFQDLPYEIRKQILSKLRQELRSLRQSGPVATGSQAGEPKPERLH